MSRNEISMLGFEQRVKLLCKRISWTMLRIASEKTQHIEELFMTAKEVRTLIDIEPQEWLPNVACQRITIILSLLLWTSDNDRIGGNL